MRGDASDLAIDGLAFPRLDGPMELIAPFWAIGDAKVAAWLLLHLGLPTHPPPRGPPWRAKRTLPARPPEDHLGGDAPAFAD